jgi:peptidoglycan/LPS O-acetylase OafA/YrhL
MSGVALHYRPDVDGLRAVAIISVLLFHAFPDRLPGGFVGVDIFFFISGFLMSGIILKDLQRVNFSFADFYARRVGSIFPALLLVLTVCLVFGWFVLLPDEYGQLAKHTVAGAAFMSNLLLWHQSGYFDAAARSKTSGGRRCRGSMERF